MSSVASLCEASKKAKIQHELGKLDGSVCFRGDDGIDQRSGYRARGCERCVRRDATRIAKPGGESIIDWIFVVKRISREWITDGCARDTGD